MDFHGGGEGLVQGIWRCEAGNSDRSIIVGRLEKGGGQMEEKEVMRYRLLGAFALQLPRSYQRPIGMSDRKSR